MVFMQKMFFFGLEIFGGGETVGGRVQWPGKDNCFRRDIAPMYTGRAQPQWAKSKELGQGFPTHHPFCSAL